MAKSARTTDSTVQLDPNDWQRARALAPKQEEIRTFSGVFLVSFASCIGRMREPRCVIEPAVFVSIVPKMILGLRNGSDRGSHRGM